MANRSYLYALDQVPGQPGGPGDVRAVSEWNWQIPVHHHVLMTGGPHLCPSTIWERQPAIVADYDVGVANFERYLAALPQTDQVRVDTAAAREALHDPRRRGRYLLLEPAEVLVLTLDDEQAQGEAFDAGLARAFEQQVAEIGRIEDWLQQAPRTSEHLLAEATGGGSWSTVNYYEPGLPAGTDAPPRPQFAPPTAPTAPTAPGVGQAIPATQPPMTAPGPLVGQPVPYAMPPGPPPTGSIAWSIGLLCLIPLPFLSAFVAGILMGVIGPAQRRKGPLAAGNGRRAANWGFSYALLTLLFGAGHFTLLATLTRDAPSTTFFPIGIPLTIWLIISVVHVVVCFRGAVLAGRGQVFAPPALPIVLR